MDQLTAVTALTDLIDTVAGKHESAALKSDLALVSAAASLLATTLVPRLDPALNLPAVDAALAKALGGIADTIRAIEGGSASTTATIPEAAPAEAAPPEAAPPQT